MTPCVGQHEWGEFRANAYETGVVKPSRLSSPTSMRAWWGERYVRRRRRRWHKPPPRWRERRRLWRRLVPLQVYETLLTRHTLIVVGPTGGGKSLVINALAGALDAAMDKKVELFVINPKAQSTLELYGNMDPVTREWTDGVLSNIFRNINQPLPSGKVRVGQLAKAASDPNRAVALTSWRLQPMHAAKSSADHGQRRAPNLPKRRPQSSEPSMCERRSFRLRHAGERDALTGV